VAPTIGPLTLYTTPRPQLRLQGEVSLLTAAVEGVVVDVVVVMEVVVVVAKLVELQLQLSLLKSTTNIFKQSRTV